MQLVVEQKLEYEMPYFYFIDTFTEKKITENQ